MLESVASAAVGGSPDETFTAGNDYGPGATPHFRIDVGHVA